MDLVIVPKKVLAMYSLHGYYSRYVYHTQHSKTYFEAYEKTELEFVETFGQRRYCSYSSFRQSKRRWNAKKINQ